MSNLRISSRLYSGLLAAALALGAPVLAQAEHIDRNWRGSEKAERWAKHGDEHYHGRHHKHRRGHYYRKHHQHYGAYRRHHRFGRWHYEDHRAYDRPTYGYWGYPYPYGYGYRPYGYR